MKIRRLLVAAVITTSAVLGLTPAKAVEMCEYGKVQVNALAQDARWCSPFRPYSTHCYYYTFSDSTTGNTVRLYTEACYPTRLW
ncbi:MAG: hypothetical protein ACR2L3_04195 [Actinomycetota bacterium]